MGKNLDMKTILSGINITNSRTLLNIKYSEMNSGLGWNYLLTVQNTTEGVLIPLTWYLHN